MGKARWIAGLVLGILFLAVIVVSLFAAAQPPRLADPTPTIAGTIQARGAYNPFTNVQQVLAVVAPLVTTVLGYVFGVQGRDEANQRANQQTTRADKATAAAVDIAARKGALDDLRERHPDVLPPPTATP
jgi:hypothetical protein